ncbi:glucose 1-dehydrogenase [Halioxenophilus sp. WMMB6]|uniref:SDR family NAD(P)-dependent oxidoreductase n=1 Tax=Halioxenophilus sp. WMMB6 TaxID=3073815 RepID=UPI00295E3DD0|nr:glucose 1-dehydrogenase [Halioxenophilus sp. WMMB6]
MFTDKTVLVTGAGGGLGQAIVRAFHEAGANVVIADIALDSAQALAEELTGRALAVALDVSSENDWQRALEQAEQAFGLVSVVVNNAGFFQPNIAFEAMPLALWRRHFSVNADGVFLGCKHAINHMKGRVQGAVVNIGSGMSIKAVATASAYCASKAAVLMTTRTAAASAGPYGIRVNAVLPGAVPTNMLMGNLVAGQEEEALLDNLRGYSALGRLAQPDDIARAVLFLADPRNSAITGIYLPVDGGNMPGA